MLTETQETINLYWAERKIDINNPYCFPNNFSDAVKMTEKELLELSQKNSWEVGSVNLKVLKDVAGEFMDTGVFFTCLSTSAEVDDEPCVVVTGSVAYLTYCKQFNEGREWFFQMASLDRKGPGKTIADLDLYVSNRTMKSLSKKGFKFEKTGSNPNLSIAKVEEDNLMTQIHAVNSDVHPLVACSYLATDLMALSIVFRGSKAYFVDPHSALSKGPWKQEFPYRIFDEDNFLLCNQPKRALTVLIWGMFTPFFPEKFEGEKTIRNKVSSIIEQMDETSLLSISKKYLQCLTKEPFSFDLYDESITYQVVRLAKLGILPALLYKTENSTESTIEEAYSTLVSQITLSIENMRYLGVEGSQYLPPIAFGDHHKATMENDSTFFKEFVKQIEWKKLIEITLPKPI